MLRAALALALALSLAAPEALAADPNTPHPHQGVLAPYPQPPQTPVLTEAERASLAAGEVIRKQTQGEAGGRGIAIQDVHAPPEVVWRKILDFANYPTMVENVYECEVYARSGDHIRTRFKIGAMGVKVEYFIDHTYNAAGSWMTWTLDYTRDSDLDDSVGYWKVEALPDRPGYTRVYYSVDVRMRGWVPGFIESMISRSGLTKATDWVKRESEAAAG